MDHAVMPVGAHLYSAVSHHDAGWGTGYSSSLSVPVVTSHELETRDYYHSGYSSLVEVVVVVVGVRGGVVHTVVPPLQNILPAHPQSRHLLAPSREMQQSQCLEMCRS